MDGLFEGLVVEDCPNLPVAVAGPVGGHYLNLTLTYISPKGQGHVISKSSSQGHVKVMSRSVWVMSRSCQNHVKFDCLLVRV